LAGDSAGPGGSIMLAVIAFVCVALAMALPTLGGVLK
jgi:hypothetical protein